MSSTCCEDYQDQKPNKYSEINPLEFQKEQDDQTENDIRHQSILEKDLNILDSDIDINEFQNEAAPEPSVCKSKPYRMSKALEQTYQKPNKARYEENSYEIPMQIDVQMNMFS